ncbi:MAG: response regulator transcription factor [Oscillospiraceae bacterium]
MISILIVEDEKPISNLIRISLSDAGYSCSCAYDGEQAANMIELDRYDLVLLDVMLGKISGFELIDYIRQYEIPVIFLSARSEISDKVKGLKLGAEDYITKPFAIAELLARVENVLRRYKKTQNMDYEDIHVDIFSHSVTKGDIPISLTVKEYDLLLLFIQNKNIALFKNQIYSKVWGDDYMGNSRTVDLHIQRLRKKLGLENKLVTVYKIGYRLEEGT